MGGQVVITLNKQAETGGEAFIQGCRKKKRITKQAPKCNGSKTLFMDSLTSDRGFK